MSDRSGFTLIEMALVVVIIGILASIAVANIVTMADRAKEADVMATAHTVQLAAEAFAARHGGVYSDDQDDLLPGLPGGVLQRNPFTGERTEPRFGARAATPGEVGIAVTVRGGVNVGYTITGCGRDGVIVVELGGN